MNEASTLVKLEHKNLVQLLGYCIAGTKVYFLYDSAPYASLHDLIFGKTNYLKFTALIDVTVWFNIATLRELMMEFRASNQYCVIAIYHGYRLLTSQYKRLIRKSIILGCGTTR